MYADLKFFITYILLTALFLTNTAYATKNHPDDESTLDAIIENNQESGRNLDDFLEGDMMTKKESEEKPQNSAAGVSSYEVMRWGKWVDGVVPYTIDSRLTSYESGVIRKAMNDIEAASCILFVEKESHHYDYLDIIKVDGCWSWVGRQGGLQQVSIGVGCAHNYIVIHELYHALGFYHEQSRHDRDEYVHVYYENIKDGRSSNFNKQSTYQTQDYGVDYDKKSIMHYGQYAFSKNNKKTVESLSEPDESLGGRYMTNSDIEQLNLHYECSSTQPEECKDESANCECAKEWCYQSEAIRKNCPLSCDICTVTTTTTESTTTTTEQPTTTEQTTTTATTTEPTTTTKPTTTTTTEPTTTTTTTEPTTTTTEPTTTTTTTTEPTTTTTTTTEPTTTTTTTEPTTTTTTTEPTTTTTTTEPTTTTTTTTEPTTTTTTTEPTTTTTTTTEPTTTTTESTTTEDNCYDSYKVSCPTWANEYHYCLHTYVSFMEKYCRLSCELCTTTTELTTTTEQTTTEETTTTEATTTETTTTTEQTTTEETTTTEATTTTETTSTEPDCYNNSHYCDTWENYGYCTKKYVAYMSIHCRKACGFCD